MEFALVLPLLALVVFGTIDIGRVFRLSTRLENAAREGAGAGQFAPLRVSSGCHGQANVVDRVKGEDASLASEPGFVVRVFKRDGPTGSLVPPGGIAGCDVAVAGLSVVPGDRLVVEVEAALDALTPFVGRATGARITLRGTHEVVVQG